MLRTSILTAALLVGACAPAPVMMPATQASEVLERFAAGNAPGDICTAQGRALLRGAVRAYGAAMAEAGETWPNAPAFGRAAESITSVEVMVMISVASGFVEMSDLRGPARALAGQMTFAHWPSVRDLRRASEVACPELVQLQQTASRFVMERERFDGADVTHLLRARGHVIDWPRLIARFGDYQMVLAAHLLLFRFAYSDADRLIPEWVFDQVLTSRKTLPALAGR